MNTLIEIHRINCPIREEINSFLNFKVSLTHLKKATGVNV